MFVPLDLPSWLFCFFLIVHQLLLLYQTFLANVSLQLARPQSLWKSPHVITNAVCLKHGMCNTVAASGCRLLRL